MRITLIHKTDAGSGAPPREELLRDLEQAGHDVRYCTRDDDWRRELSRDSDMVLIAGGDGTVATVVTSLIGTDLPFAIFPLGTANNIATELGWTEMTSEMLMSLENTRRQRFSLGVARGPWGTRHFLEGVGLGPFARTISFAKSQKQGLMKPPTDRKAKLHRDLQLVAAFLTECRPESCRLELDDETVEGDFLLVEIMNTGRIGPNIQLAPEADVADDVLDVVTVGEAERQRLTEYLERRQEGECPAAILPRRRARHIRLTVEAARVHIDDDVWPKASTPPPPVGARFEIDVRLGKEYVTALVPASSEKHRREVPVASPA